MLTEDYILANESKSSHTMSSTVSVRHSSASTCVPSLEDEERDIDTVVSLLNVRPGRCSRSCHRPKNILNVNSFKLLSNSGKLARFDRNFVKSPRHRSSKKE